MNAAAAKPSRDVRVADKVTLFEPGHPPRTVLVRGTSEVRGPAPVAQLLYEETAESLAAREASREARRQGIEPALTLEQGRPTKRGPPAAGRLEPLERLGPTTTETRSHPVFRSKRPDSGLKPPDSGCFSAKDPLESTGSRPICLPRPPSIVERRRSNP